MTEEIKEFSEAPCVWAYFPPPEVFIAPDRAFGPYQTLTKGKLQGFTIILKESGGMFVKDEKEKFLYPGVPCPPIIDALSVAKRAISERIKHLRNPLFWFLIPSLLKEIESIVLANVSRYFLKPERYSHAVREFHRVLTILFPRRTILVNFACMFLEFDSAYRWVWQAFMGNMEWAEFYENPRKVIVRESYAARGESGNYKIEELIRAIPFIVNVGWFLWPLFRRSIKEFAREVELDRIRMTEEDLYFQFK